VVAGCHEQRDTNDLQAQDWSDVNRAVKQRGSLSSRSDGEMAWDDEPSAARQRFAKPAGGYHCRSRVETKPFGIMLGIALPVSGCIA